MLAFPLLFLLSLLFFRSVVAAALPLLVGGLAIVGTFAALRLANGVDRRVGVRAQPDHRARPGAGDRLLAVHRGALPRGDGTRPARAPRRCAATLATAGRTVLFSSLTVAAALASLLVFPQRFLYSMGLGGVAGRAARRGRGAARAARGAGAARRTGSTRSRRAGSSATRERDARPAEAGLLVPAVALRDAPARTRRGALRAVVLLLAGLPFLGIKFTSVDATVLPERQDQPPGGHAAQGGLPARAGNAVNDRRRTRRRPRRCAPTPATSAQLPGAAGATPPRRIDAQDVADPACSQRRPRARRREPGARARHPRPRHLLHRVSRAARRPTSWTSRRA